MCLLTEQGTMNGAIEIDFRTPFSLYQQRNCLDMGMSLFVNLTGAARRMAQPLLCCVMDVLGTAPAPAFWMFLTVRQ